MIYSERPAIYSEVIVDSSLQGKNKGKLIGLAAVSKTGAALEGVWLESANAAITEFGADCPLTKLATIAFLNGASGIYAVSVAVDETPTNSDYEDAFAVLMKQESIKIMICDSTDEDVHEALKDAILAANEGAKYRIALVCGTGTVANHISSAEAINCERVVLVCGKPTETAVTGGSAAALAGVLSAERDPAIPLNGVELKGLEVVEEGFSDSEIDALVNGGVTPVESPYGVSKIVRGITTKTKTNSVSDMSLRELTTISIIDEVLPKVRDALKLKFSRTKNTTQTRGAIRTELIILLEDYLRREIIDAFSSVSVEAYEDDPTICLVSFDFTVTHGLNSILLKAHISV